MSGIWRESERSSSDDSDAEETVKNIPVAVAKVPSVSEWLSGTWPLKPFDEALPTNKRKAEWVRFRDQFDRIVSCKAPVVPGMRLTGMKIFAGNYLLSIIELHEKLIDQQSVDVYADTVIALNR